MIMPLLRFIPVSPFHKMKRKGGSLIPAAFLQILVPCFLQSIHKALGINAATAKL